MCGRFILKLVCGSERFAPSALGPPRGQSRPSVDRRSAIGQTPKLCRGTHPTCQMMGRALNRIIGHGGRYEYQHQRRVLASAWAVPLGSTKPCPWRVVATPSFAQRVGESRRLHVARYRLVAPRSRIRRIKHTWTNLRTSVSRKRALSRVTRDDLSQLVYSNPRCS
jgi:hypothetical protein